MSNQEAESKSTPQPRSDIDEISVLLVDDEPEFTAMVKEQLDQLNDSLTVKSSRDGESALEKLDGGGGFDCIVSDYKMPKMDGLEFLSIVRESNEHLPFILYTARGSEKVASQAISRGVTEYIRKPASSEDFSVLSNRIQRLVNAQRNRQRAKHLSRVNAVVRDISQLATRATARCDLLEAICERLADSDPYRFAWYGEPDYEKDEIEPIVHAGIEGDYLGEIQITTTEGETSKGPSGRAVHSKQVEVVQSIDQAEDYRPWREAALEHGFYSSAAVPILYKDDLYGILNLYASQSGAFDELEQNILSEVGRTIGHAINRIETTNTLEIRNHELATSRERYRALNTITRELLYADSDIEIGEIVKEAITELFGRRSVTLFRFDEEKGVLRPLQSPSNHPTTTPEAIGPSNSPEWTAFAEDEIRVEKVDEDRSEEPSSNRPYSRNLLVPVGEHGLVIIGVSSEDSDRDQIQDISRILAASIAATFDRIQRDESIRERESELERKNKRLQRLNQLNEQLRTISRILVKSDSRQEIEQEVCDHLIEVDRFDFAWIGTPDDTTGGIQAKAWAGTNGSYLDSIGPVLDSGSSSNIPALRTARTEELTAISNIGSDFRSEPWRKKAMALGYRSVMSIPLKYNGIVFDVLSIYSTQRAAFDKVTRGALTDFGQAMAMTINAIERRNARLSEERVELEVDLTDQNCVFHRMVRETGCSMVLHDIIRNEEGSITPIVKVSESDLEQFIDLTDAMTTVDDVAPIKLSESTAIVQLQFSNPSIATRVAEHGGRLKGLTANESGVEVKIGIPDSVDVRAFINTITNFYPNANLRSKRRRSGSETTSLGESELMDQFTDRQLEIVKTAYNSGFFNWPRESSGEEISDLIGISPPTFHRHLRMAERKVFARLLDHSESDP